MAGRDDDDSLALRSRDGDPVALARLYRRHAPRLLRYVERMLDDTAEAEDVLQETFVRVFEGRGRYRGRDRFRSWLFTIATRIAFDRARQRRRHAELLEQRNLEVQPSAAADPWDQLTHEEILARIESVLADLPTEYAVAFHLRVREEFSYREMAEICGDPEGTLRSRVHHALKRVRDAIQRQQPGNAAGRTRENGAIESDGRVAANADGEE